MLIEKRLFSAGMDGDTSPKLLSDKASLNIMNARFGLSEFGRTGRVENIPGTTLISQRVIPPYGTNLCIGSAQDEGRTRIIYCLWNSFNDHGIYCLDYSTPSTPVIYAVLYDSQVIGGLNFSKTSRIDKNARVVDGMFYWTDNNSEPRRVNIDAAIKTNHAAYSTDETPYDYPMNAEVITIARKPPNYTLAFTKTTSGAVGITVNNNQIKTFSGRFAWYYTFRDGETSTLSPHSLLIPYNTPTDTYDVVTITAPLAEKIGQDVHSVTLVAIYADGETGFEVKTWNKDNTTDFDQIAAHNAGSTPLTFQFTNSEVGAAVSSFVLSKPFDSIPIISKTLEKASNRIFLGNNLSGYDTPKTSSLTAATVTSTVSPVAIKTGSSRRVGIVFFDKYMRQCGVVPYSKLITIAERGFTLPSTYEYAVQWGLSNANALNEIPDWAYYYAPVSTKDITRSYFLQAFAGNLIYVSRGADGVYSYDKTTYSVDHVGVGIKLNTLAGMGMGYSFTEGDLVRVSVMFGSTVTTTTLSVKATDGDYLIAENYDFGTIDNLSVAVFEVYTPNNKSASNFYYEQGNVYAITNPTTNTRSYSTTSGLILGDVYMVQRDTLNKVSYNITYGAMLAETLFTLGCNYVSQLASSTKYSVGSSPLQSTSGFNPLTDNSRWILKTNASDVPFTFKGTIQFSTNMNTDFHAYIEYNDGTNKTAIDLVPLQNTVAFQVYTVSFDVDVIMSANCRMYIFGACSSGSPLLAVYLYNKSMAVTTMADGTKTTFECMSPNDKFFQNWFTNAGRVQIVDTIGQRRLKTAIRWSNTLVDDTTINGLSSFDALDQKILHLELDELNKLQLANKIDEQGQGNVMLGICTSETVSMYLGEVQLMAAAKAGDVATSNDVIGSINVLKGSYGTINPESVVEYLGLVCWIDAINGMAVQYSANGLEPISRYGQSRFFKRYLTEYAATNNNNIDNINGFHHLPTCIDPFYKEFIFTLPALIYSNYASVLPSYSSIPSYATSIINRFDIFDYLGKTMAFAFLDNKWGNDYEYMAEHYEYIQNTMFGFKNGSVYVHNNDTVNYNKFYGTNYPVRICFTGNINPSTLKDLANIAIEGNAKPDFTVAYADRPNIQITDLSSDDYTDDEGIYYAYFLMDRLSPNVSGTADEKLYTGDVLKDIVLKFMLEFQSYNSLLYINFVDIGYRISRGQKQILNPINT